MRGVLPQLCYFLFFLLSTSDAGSLRGKNEGTLTSTQEQTRRKLEWKFVSTGTVVSNSNSFDDYDGKEIPKDKSISDSRDKLRSTDVCYRNGSYSLSNCPPVPDCNFSNEKIGQAKLCINRMPSPTGIFYVAVMKCIPQWENCDKCLCGHISSEKSMDSFCIFNSKERASDDYWKKADCNDLSKIKFQKYSWTVDTKATVSGSYVKPPSTSQGQTTSNGGGSSAYQAAYEATLNKQIDMLKGIP